MNDVAARSPVYSIDGLVELVAGDKSQLQELLLLYYRNQADIIRQLLEVPDDDLLRMSQLAHRLAGAARGISAMYLAASCEALESAARASDRLRAVECREKLLSAAANVEQAVKADLALAREER